MCHLRVLREEWGLCPLLLVDRLQALYVIRLDAIQAVLPLIVLLEVLPR